jgi:hypothetical protein
MNLMWARPRLPIRWRRRESNPRPQPHRLSVYKYGVALFTSSVGRSATAQPTTSHPSASRLGRLAFPLAPSLLLSAAPDPRPIRRGVAGWLSVRVGQRVRDHVHSHLVRSDPGPLPPTSARGDSPVSDRIRQSRRGVYGAPRSGLHYRRPRRVTGRRECHLPWARRPSPRRPPCRAAPAGQVGVGHGRPWRKRPARSRWAGRPPSRAIPCACRSRR